MDHPRPQHHRLRLLAGLTAAYILVPHLWDLLAQWPAGQFLEALGVASATLALLRALLWHGT